MWVKKKHNKCEKDYISNPATCCCENGEYLANNSAIMCDEIIEETKTVPTNFNEKNQLAKHKISHLLITIVLLIAVSIYCYLIKYQTKQKHYYTVTISHHK